MDFLKLYYDKMNQQTPSYAVTGYNYETKKASELSPGERADYQKSTVAQKHLSFLAKVLMNNNGKSRYFRSDGGTRDNMNTLKRVTRKLFVPAKWQVKGGGQFEILESYREFNAENFSQLRRWAATIPKEVYITDNVQLGEYDFAKSGFPIKVNLKAYSGNLLFSPGSEFTVINTILPLSEREASEFLNEFGRERRVILLYKIKFHGINEKNLGMPTHHYLEFDLSDPIVEVYCKEPNLTRKIGEIDIEIDNP